MLHLAINDCGELLGCYLTPGNVDDRRPVSHLVKDLWGRLFGDKGYISQPLATRLAGQGLRLVTKLKKNMKNRLMSLTDKLLLRKRSLIETVNDQLKNISQVEHTRHRSLWNFLGNVAAGPDRLHVAGEETVAKHSHRRTVSYLELTLLTGGPRTIGAVAAEQPATRPASASG